MPIVNTETLPGREITEILGLVQGNTIRAKHLGRDITASFKKATDAGHPSIGTLLSGA